MNDEIESLRNEADQLSEAGQFEQALPLYEQALTLARQSHNRLVEGIILGSLGNAYFAQGDYAQAVERAVWASLIFIELESPNLRIAFNQLTRLRRQVGLDQFEEWLKRACEPFQIDYSAYRDRLEQAQVFSDTQSLNRALKQMAYTAAQAALGVPEALQVIQTWIAEVREMPDWADLAGVFERILAGERDNATLLTEAKELDTTGKAIVELTLAVIADPERMRALQAEVAPSHVQGRTENGLTQMQQRLAEVLSEVLQGYAPARREIETDVLPLFEEEKSDYKALAVVMRRMLAGETAEASLLDPANGLDEIDRTIVQTAFSLAQSAASVAPPLTEAATSEDADDPQTEARYQNFIALLVAAARGQAEERATALSLTEQMQQQPETQRLAEALERLIVQGGGDQAELTQGLDAEDAALVETVLDELAEQA